jgi:hypothetical protein
MHLIHSTFDVERSMFDVHLFLVKRVKELKKKRLFFSPGATKTEDAAPFERVGPGAGSTAGVIPGEIPRAAPEHRQLAVLFVKLV